MNRQSRCLPVSVRRIHAGILAIACSWCLLGAFGAVGAVEAFQQPCSPSHMPYHCSTGRCSHARTTSTASARMQGALFANDETDSEDDSNEEPSTTLPAKMISPTRREALASAAAAALAATAAATSAPSAQALDVPNFLLPKSQQTVDGGKVYQQARRATAYLVDSTIPPSLVPFRASREAAILKQLGMGSGTPKEPYVEESLNLNNIAQKGIYGAVDGIKSVGKAAGIGGDGSAGDGGGSAKPAGKKDATFVFMGVDPDSSDDIELAVGLLTDIVKPRQRGESTALGLAFCPQSTQEALDAYSKGKNDDSTLIDALIASGVDQSAIDINLPLLRFAKSKRMSLLALSPEVEDLKTVRSEGLQNVNLERRQKYVADAEGFIALTQDPKYKLYAEKSLFKDFVPLNDKDTSGDFFAERILVHEAMATASARWAMSHPDSLVVAVAPISDVRYMGGPNGRLPRVCKFVNPLATGIDESAITTILLNPSAKETLSMSKFLRLEIGTTPQTLKYQTKVADYIWFSAIPKVNVLPRMMNVR